MNIDEDIYEFSNISNNTTEVTYGNIKQKNLLTWVLVIVLIGVVIINLVMWANPFDGEIKEMSKLYHAEKKKNIELQKENAIIRANCEKLMTTIETWRRRYIEVRDFSLSQEKTIKTLVKFSNQTNCCYVPPREAQAICLRLIKMGPLFKSWLAIIQELRK